MTVVFGESCGLMISDYFLYFKALHLVFMVTWFAGLFYIVRLYIYFVEASRKKEPEKNILENQLLLMARRLWYIITWPGMILTAVFGVLLILANPEVMKNGWFHAKLSMVILLVLYHLNTGRILKKLANHTFTMSAQKLRMYNELPTVFLFAIVFLVVLKTAMSLLFAVIGVVVLGILLMTGIQVYKKFRR